MREGVHAPCAFVPTPVECHAHWGRKKYYGKPLLTPEKIRQDDSIPWQEVKAFAAGKRHTFEVKVVSRVRWRGTGNRDIQLIVIRPLAYRPKKGHGSFLAIRHIWSVPIRIFLWLDYCRPICGDGRIEVNFRDEKTVMGVGEAQVRTRSSVESVPALVVASYAYLLLAVASRSSKIVNLPRPKWYPAKSTDRCSTQRLIALFRTQLWRLAINRNKTRFANYNPCTTNRAFYDFPLSSAVFHARK